MVLSVCDETYCVIKGQICVSNILPPAFVDLAFKNVAGSPVHLRMGLAIPEDWSVGRWLPGMMGGTAATLLSPRSSPSASSRESLRYAGAERAGSGVEQVGQVWGNAEGPALAAELLPTCEP